MSGSGCSGGKGFDSSSYFCGFEKLPKVICFGFKDYVAINNKSGFHTDLSTPLASDTHIYIYRTKRNSFGVHTEVYWVQDGFAKCYRSKSTIEIHQLDKTITCLSQWIDCVFHYSIFVLVLFYLAACSWSLPVYLLNFCNFEPRLLTICCPPVL